METEQSNEIYGNLSFSDFDYGGVVSAYKSGNSTADEFSDVRGAFARHILNPIRCAAINHSNDSIKVIMETNGAQGYVGAFLVEGVGVSITYGSEKAKIGYEVNGEEGNRIADARNILEEIVREAIE